MIGLSPTLPGCLAVIPPVEVANARFPRLSRATAPTVSCPEPSALEAKSKRAWSKAVQSRYQFMQVWDWGGVKSLKDDDIGDGKYVTPQGRL